MTELASLDGQISPADETVIPATDEGFLRGDGVFEVVRIYDGAPFALKDHLARFARSASNLRLELPSAALLHDETLQLIAERDERFDGVVRLVVTRGGRRLLLTEPLPAKSSAITVTLGAITYSPPRVLDGVKSLSYGGNMLATRLAQEQGYDEALLVTPHGRVLEAPTSSLFWVDETGTLCTTPLEEHILASITRARVMRLVDVKEQPVTLEELVNAREAFLASTTREVQAVSAVETFEFESAPGEQTTAASEAFRQHVEEELQAVKA